MSAKLSDTQRRALEKLFQEETLLHDRSAVWDFGSTTVNRLRKWGFIRVRDGYVDIAVEGCAALGKEHPAAAEAKRFREDTKR